MDKTIAYALLAAGGILLVSSYMKSAQKKQANQDAVDNGGTVVYPDTLSDAGLAMLSHEEGENLSAYPDAGKYSIGFGHLIVPGDGLSPSSTINHERALELLASDVEKAETIVFDAVDVPISQTMFDALVLLVYNIGQSPPTLIRLLNAGDVDGAAEQFDRWNQSEGHVNPVLVARRAREKNLFKNGVYS